MVILRHLAFLVGFECTILGAFYSKNFLGAKAENVVLTSIRSCGICLCKKHHCNLIIFKNASGPPRVPPGAANVLDAPETLRTVNVVLEAVVTKVTVKLLI